MRGFHLLVLIVLSPAAFVGALSAQTVLGSFPFAVRGIPIGLDAAPGGNLYFTSVGPVDEIGIIDRAGRVQTVVPVTANSGNPLGITRGGARLYVTDTTGQEVDVYDLAFNYLTSFPVGVQTTFPEGIAWSSITNNLYVVDGTAANVFEYDLMGNLIATFPINGRSVDGIAHDPISNTFWVADSGTDTVREYDASFNERRSFPGPAAAGIGDAEGVALIGDRLHVCAWTAATIVEFSTRDPRLIGAAGPTPASGTLSADPISPLEDNWYVRLNAIDPTVTRSRVGLPFFAIVNVGVGSAPVGGVTRRIPGFVQVWPLSVPAGPLLVLAGPSVVGGATEFVTRIPPGIFAPTDEIRIQGLMFDPAQPGSGLDRLAASNAISFRHRAPVSVSIRVTCTGSNSFNNDTASGFFSVENFAALDITSVVFDWVNSSNPAQATMEFDTDQVAMADLFEGGNSATPGCIGTFRNGSDVATGLVYDAMNTINATPCDPAANSGWVGTNRGNGVDDWRTLEFRFAPGAFVAGQTFEFDCDTDGGAGAGGDDMAGMVVTVTLSDGTVLSGEVAAAGADVGRLTL